MDDCGKPVELCFGEITIKIEVDRGIRRWYRNGVLHREDGPAIEHADGTKVWCRNGKLHREDGPAIESTNGTNVWCRNGEFHREDGPAVERVDGGKEWYLRGMEETEHDHRRKVAQPKLFIAVCVSRRYRTLKRGKRYWLPAELWKHLAENYFAL